MGFLRNLWNAIRRRLNELKTSRLPGGGSQFLCDTCKYSYGNVCNRPERPNAVKCPDYKRKK